MVKKQHPALEILSELLSVPSPSGREERLAQLVRGRLEGMGYAAETDAAGNVMVRLPGSDPSAPLMVLAAHMDEIGMVVTQVGEDGRLSVQRSGGLQPHRIGERPVTVVGDHGTVVGILSLDLSQTFTADAGVTWAEARILTGLTREQLRAAGIRNGSTAVPVADGRGPVVFGDEADPSFAAWTMDDRLGVVMLLQLLDGLRQHSRRPKHPTIVAFTVREETGAQGAKVLAAREKPEIFIAIDGSPVVDDSDLQPDGRPAVWSRDSKCHYDQRLILDFVAAAAAAGTEAQIAVQTASAFTDASAVFDCGLVPRVATVGHVRENRHGYEIARLSVCDNLLEMLVQFVTAGAE